MKPPVQLIQLIEAQSAHSPAIELCRLRDEILARYGNAVQGMLYYGSCLRSGDALDGLVDLYVLVDSYRAAYHKRSLAFSNKVLPPNVFYLELALGDRTVRAKYALVSMADFRAGTSKRWFHSYLWARFAQPVGILYARNDQVEQEIYTSLGQAVLTFLSRVLPELPAHFDAAEVWRRGLSLTYRSELRTEKPHRSAQLVDSFGAHFEALTRAAMPALPYAVEATSGSDTVGYHASISMHRRLLSHLTWALRRVQGKFLSLLRLLKAAFTFQGGIDYIAWKLERHSGVPVEVTPRLRRYPLIFVWGLMWRLYRRGVFR